MPSYDENLAECLVFTFKQGLLSPVAHDLRLRVTRFRVELNDAATEVEASFDTSSLVVEVAMKDGRENPSALSPADKQQIAEQVRSSVLHSQRHPLARFRSSWLQQRPDGGFDVAGDLTLHGVTRPLRAQTRAVAGRQQLELTLHQPDFGITPYRALLGALKLQSDVKLSIKL